MIGFGWGALGLPGIIRLAALVLPVGALTRSTGADGTVPFIRIDN